MIQSYTVHSVASASSCPLMDILRMNADDFNRMDYGLVGGLGLGFNHLNIGMRYNYGLKSVGHSGSLSGDLTQNSKNSALSFYIGMALFFEF